MPKKSKRPNIGVFDVVPDDTALARAAARSLERAVAAELLQAAKTAGAVGSGTSSADVTRRMQHLRFLEARRKATAAGFVSSGNTERDIGRRLNAIRASLSPSKKIKKRRR